LTTTLFDEIKFIFCLHHKFLWFLSDNMPNLKIRKNDSNRDLKPLNRLSPKDDDEIYYHLFN